MSFPSRRALRPRCNGTTSRMCPDSFRALARLHRSDASTSRRDDAARDPCTTLVAASASQTSPRAGPPYRNATRRVPSPRSHLMGGPTKAIQVIPSTTLPRSPEQRRPEAQRRKRWVALHKTRFTPGRLTALGFSCEAPPPQRKPAGLGARRRPAPRVAPTTPFCKTIPAGLDSCKP